MKISYVRIENFKYIDELVISEVDQALILVGKNNTGKTSVLDAIRLATSDYELKPEDFLYPNKNIIIDIKVELREEELKLYHSKGIVSRYRNYDLWYKDFCSKLPSYQDEVLSFQCMITKDGKKKYNDGYKKNNTYIPHVLPRIYNIGHNRNLTEIEESVIRLYDNSSLSDLRDNICMFDKQKICNLCFQCIGVINKKSVEELNSYEAGRLFQYKVMSNNLKDLSDKVTKHFHANGSPSRDIEYAIDFNLVDSIKTLTKVYNSDRNTVTNIDGISAGLKSIYTLSLLEAYIEDEDTLPCIITIKDPELFLHPQLQKVASEILYRLSKKNQIMFSTHSPTMIFNFSSRQIKQVVLNDEYNTVINENPEIDDILDDLGYTANDIMNVNFVFIVEGKQDSSRLPLLLEKYYSEIHDEEGKLQRISIITTNSCTNIKTYANLKYINQLYLKDQFLMIRDSDGKNPKHLVKQLCNYYSARSKEDIGNLPRVTPRNVLILKYYSFENYFLDPEIMTKIGVIKSVEEFYTILYKKYKDYLYKLSSTKRMIKALDIRIRNVNDLKNNMEAIKIYVRGHNLFDIFYGRYKRENQTEILKKYIDIAPRDNFKDILDAIDAFVYFENRKKTEEEVE